MKNAMQRIFPGCGAVEIGVMVFASFACGIMRSCVKQSDSKTRLSKRDLTAQGLIGLSVSLFLLCGSVKVSDAAHNADIKNIEGITYGVLGTLLSPVSFMAGIYTLGQGSMDLYHATENKPS